jgi:serine/threonine-protein phosphatase 2B catalytic subunit
MLLAILSICSQEELADDDEDGESGAPSTEELAARRQLIKSKILAVGRMQKVFQLLRCVIFSIYRVFLLLMSFPPFQ